MRCRRAELVGGRRRAALRLQRAWRRCVARRRRRERQAASVGLAVVQVGGVTGASWAQCRHCGWRRGSVHSGPISARRAVAQGLVAVNFAKPLAVAPAITLHLDDRVHRLPAAAAAAGAETLALGPLAAGLPNQWVRAARPTSAQCQRSIVAAAASAGGAQRTHGRRPRTAHGGSPTTHQRMLADAVDGAGREASRLAPGALPHVD
jgi:hypothetical protein